MRSRINFLLLLILFSLASMAQTAPAAKPADASSDPHYKLIFSNEYTRVHLLKLAAGENYRFTVPSPFIRISIDDGSLAMSPDKSAQPGPIKKASAEFFEKGAEQYIENRGEGRYRAVIVEVLKGKLTRRTPQGMPVLGQVPPSATSVDADPMDLGAVTELALAIPPGDFTKWHTHKYPHLIVAVSDLDLVNETKGKPKTTLEMKDGEVKWVPALSAQHRIGNAEKPHPEDPMKKVEREQEGETEHEVEGAAIYYAIEFK